MPKATPALTDALLTRLSAKGYRSPEDYRILPLDHDFASDKAFPDPTVSCVALAPVSNIKNLVDALLQKVWCGLHQTTPDRCCQIAPVILHDTPRERIDSHIG